MDDVIEYIESLPSFDAPEIFGMHSNASISFLQEEGNNLIRTILNVQMQPVVSKRNLGSKDDENNYDKEST
mgnify:CR=1 FL=1